ncbi:type I toxin-antitoxin system Ibs family toxin, partial [Salmonella enterica]|nr:type I toxin-antitoxin system Ibs family toxin [Salmonella enterica]
LVIILVILLVISLPAY